MPILVQPFAFSIARSFDEPGAVVPHAGICEGGRPATSDPTLTAKFMDDPIAGILERTFFIDVPTLAFMAEVALGDKEDGTFTSEALAASFYDHIQKVLASNVGDSAKKKSVVSRLELNLRTLDLSGRTSRGVPGYSCLGTIFVKRITSAGSHEVRFSFKRHPQILEICSF